MRIRGPARSRCFAAWILIVINVAVGCQRDGGSDQELLRYVSLGDSFPAGEGLPDATGPCRRSASAYPSLLAQKASVLPLLRACSGASTLEVLEREQHAEGRQLDWVTADTDVVTITIGGNDVGFSRILGACLTGVESCSRLDRVVDDRIVELKNPLEAINREIRRRSPRTRLLVVGYPHLIANANRVDLNQCADLRSSPEGGISAEEADWLRHESHALNSLLRESARVVGARYLDAAALFSGHEVCAETHWIRGFVPGNVSASFHPNAAGHEALTNLLARTLESL